MTDRILAAIARRAERLARGIDLSKEDARTRKRLRASHRMCEKRDEKAGRRRERAGRFVPFRSEP